MLVLNASLPEGGGTTQVVTEGDFPHSPSVACGRQLPPGGSQGAAPCQAKTRGFFNSNSTARQRDDVRHAALCAHCFKGRFVNRPYGIVRKPSTRLNSQFSICPRPLSHFSSQLSAVSFYNVEIPVGNFFNLLSAIYYPLSTARPQARPC